MTMIRASDLVEKFKYALSEHWGYIWGTAGVLWTSAKQAQKVQYMVSKYGTDWKKSADAKADNYYKAALYGSKWINHTVADCSGLFVWAFKQLGGSIYHGSNSIYDRYCSEKGKITDDIRKTMLPGTAVFVCKPSGNKSHIGLYAGNGKVIEEKGTEAGCCVSNVTDGKWTYYGLLKGIEYTAQDAPEQPSDPKDEETPTQQMPTLRRGNTGEYVTLLQTKLANLGYDLGKYGVDGDFGSATLAAVKAYQKANGLTVDGVVGKNTWESLMGDPKPVVYYTVTIPHLTADKADQLTSSYPGASKEEERG